MKPRRVNILTYCRTPIELGALINFGVTEILVTLPKGPDCRERILGFLNEAESAQVQVWFVADDVGRPSDMSVWCPDLGDLATDPRMGILGRHIHTLQAARQVFHQARLAYGPWPRPGYDRDDLHLQDLGVSLVWAPTWKDCEEAEALASRAGRYDMELILPLPGALTMRRWEANQQEGARLFGLVTHERIHWAAAVHQQRTLSDRCGELLEVKTVLAAKIDTPMGVLEEPLPGQFPYRQTEGFPLVYADLMRHPPGIQVASVEQARECAVSKAEQWDHAPPLLSAYIHVPFCVRRCRFCYCASSGVTSQEQQLRQDYVDALCHEIDLWKDSKVLAGRRFQTLYVGGGSPSALTPQQLSRVLTHATSALPFVEDLVVSLEMAPSSVSKEKLLAAKEAGASRLSFGIQSFSPASLERLGSAHNRAAALRALDLASETGFNDVDIDLICGIPGQSVESFLDDLKTASDRGVSSIMFFPVHVTPGLLGWWAEQGWDSRVWTAERYDRFWRESDRWLTEHGFVRFGYSHYKRALGADSVDRDAASERYFSKYMYVMPGSDGQLALGPGAIGCIAKYQYENLCQVSEYVARVNAGVLPIGAYSEPPGPDASLVWFAIERSTYPGSVERPEVEERFGLEGWARIEELLGPLVQRGLFTRQEARFEITELGTVWMGNLQYELLRSAGLQAPIGHMMAL